MKHHLLAAVAVLVSHVSAAKFPLFFYKFLITWADTYLVRDYVDSEPSHGAWGSEESY